MFGSFFRKSKLKAAISHVNKARKREGAEADHHFDSAYKGFSEVIDKDLLFTETLYNWGFTLLHQAKTKSGAEATKLYQEAIEKFSFCRMVNADSLGAAIDGGVVYMDLARLKGASPKDSLYDNALALFQEANRIQSGSASYNLACIYALRNDQEACLSALEDSRDHGSLPSVDDILGDSDLDNMKSHHWFIDFVESLKVPEEPEQESVDEKGPEEKSEENKVSVEAETEPKTEPPSYPEPSSTVQIEVPPSGEEKKD